MTTFRRPGKYEDDRAWFEEVMWLSGNRPWPSDTLLVEKVGFRSAYGHISIVDGGVIFTPTAKNMKRKLITDLNHFHWEGWTSYCGSISRKHVS